MTEQQSSSMLRLILGGAGLVVIMWGIRETQHLVLLLLISLFFAAVMAPLPRWLMPRYKLGTGAAIGVTVVLVCVAYAVITLLLVFTAVRMQQKLPFHQDHFSAIYQQLDAFASAHNIQIGALFPAKASNAERFIEFRRADLPTLAGLLSDRVLIWLLSLLFLSEMAEQDESKRGTFAALAPYGGDVRGFIAVMAKTGAIIALADLVLFVVLGVDFPVLWCVLAFFLSFIPSIGIAISLVPPVLVALLNSGLTTAVLVALGVIFINAVVGYVIQPKFMQKGLNISFLEITLSLMGWGYLLGPWGAVLAVPLTLMLRKFIAQPSHSEGMVETMLADDPLNA